MALGQPGGGGWLNLLLITFSTSVFEICENGSFQLTRSQITPYHSSTRTSLSVEYFYSVVPARCNKISDIRLISIHYCMVLDDYVYTT